MENGMRKKLYGKGIAPLHIEFFFNEYSLLDSPLFFSPRLLQLLLPVALLDSHKLLDGLRRALNAQHGAVQADVVALCV